VTARLVEETGDGADRAQLVFPAAMGSHEIPTEHGVLWWLAHNIDESATFR
jgi:hypothetical protein